MTQDIFISDIQIHNHPYIDNCDISLSADHKKNLIITGRNGSGKTTFIHLLINLLASHNLASIRPQEGNYCHLQSHQLKAVLMKQGESDKEPVKAWFNARRNVQFTQPSAITTSNATGSSSEAFLQHLVNTKSRQAFAIVNKDEDKAEKITHWFETLERYLGEIFETEIFLSFDPDELKFTLKHKDTKDAKDAKDAKDIQLNTLSDGYSAVMQIVTDIMMKMEVNAFGDYSQSGIVLIDEVETHLHVTLQKQVLPMLTKFFPNIQFIVTTHSPFVLSSVEDAIIYDIERHERIDQEEALWQ